MITSRAQLAEARECARRLAEADWDMALPRYVAGRPRDRRAIVREVVLRKLARLDADIAEYTGSPP